MNKNTQGHFHSVSMTLWTIDNDLLHNHIPSLHFGEKPADRYQAHQCGYSSDWCLRKKTHGQGSWWPDDPVPHGWEQSTNHNIKIQNKVIMPSIEMTLISVSQLTKEQDWRVTFNRKSCVIIPIEGNSMQVQLKYGLYSVEVGSSGGTSVRKCLLTLAG